MALSETGKFLLSEERKSLLRELKVLEKDFNDHRDNSTTQLNIAIRLQDVRKQLQDVEADLETFLGSK